MSIANNIDYVLSRINVPLEQPSELEVILMSTVRQCHRATKVSSKGGLGRLKAFLESRLRDVVRQTVDFFGQEIKTFDLPCRFRMLDMRWKALGRLIRMS